MQDTQRHLILVIDDKPNICEVIGGILSAAGYEVVTATSGEEGLQIYEERCPSLILTDLKMGGISGTDVIRRVRAVDSATPIILLTAHGSISSAVDAMKAGADDYLTKPVDYDLLRVKVKKVLETSAYRIENQQLKEEQRLQRSMDGLIGRSEAMGRIYSLIRTIAPTESAVLISGEPGTGKELIARSIHGRSYRASQPYVVVDCSAIPEGLMESELFGYEKGAFTGANMQKNGRIEQAEGGTLFLDEIGELPLPLQAKLLRVIQEKQFVRIGGTGPTTVDFRLIAATNKNLKEEVAEKRFRDDLYYRLNVLSIESPPLRERLEDLPLLVDAFWSLSTAVNHLPPSSIDPRHLATMMNYHWPGNVRELKNTVERLVILKSLPAEIEEIGQRERPQSSHTLPDVERTLVRNALQNANGNITHAARALGIGRKALYNRMKKYSITAP